MFDKMLKLVESAETRLTSVTSQMGEMVTSGCAHDSMAEQIATLEDQVTKLGGIACRYAAALDESLELVESLINGNPNIARVLTKRYLEPGYEPSFREIADDMGISEDYARHLHAVGLDMIAEKMMDHLPK